MSNQREEGIALILVMMTTALLAALLGSLTLATITETAIATNYRDATVALYAGDAAVEFVLQEIASANDWADLLATPGQSAFVDGPPAGIRQVGAAAIDLEAAVLDQAGMAAAPAGAVHGPPVLYAYGWLQDLAPTVRNRSRIYVAVWLADRSRVPHEEEAEPDALSIVARAFGEAGARRAVEAVVEKGDASAVRMLGWRQLL